MADKHHSRPAAAHLPHPTPPPYLTATHPTPFPCCLVQVQSHDEGSCWLPAVLRPAIVLSHCEARSQPEALGKGREPIACARVGCRGSLGSLPWAAPATCALPVASNACLPGCRKALRRAKAACVCSHWMQGGALRFQRSQTQGERFSCSWLSPVHTAAVPGPLFLAVGTEPNANGWWLPAGGTSAAPAIEHTRGVQACWRGPGAERLAGGCPAEPAAH